MVTVLLLIVFILLTLTIVVESFNGEETKSTESMEEKREKRRYVIHQDIDIAKRHRPELIKKINDLKQEKWFIDPLTYLCGQSDEVGVYDSEAECHQAAFESKPIIGVGGNCDYDFTSRCDPDAGLVCHFGKCKIPAEEGQFCDRFTLCLGGTRCTAGKCTTPKSENRPF